MTGTVSCILPVHNGARFLREAIDSVLSQDYSPLEFIVVDDGSTDDTPVVLREYGDRLIVIRQENRGAGAARNRGVAAATGQYLAFQDADDIWVPGKLRRQLARFAERPDLDLCFGHFHNFWEQELSSYAEAVADEPIAQPVRSFGPPVLLARAAAFARVGRYNETLRVGEDTDWAARAMQTGLKWEMLPEVLLRRRRHGANLTVSANKTHVAMFDVLRLSIDRRRAARSDPGPDSAPGDSFPAPA